jgi:hypothetical protein
MATNLATYYRDSAVRTSRGAEVPAASFTDGCNNGGCAGPGIGINTGNANPKPSDWWRPATRTYGTSQYIGLVAGANGRLETINGADVNNQVCFVVATAGVANNAVIDATSGAVNKTGVALVTGDWVWGEIPVA